MIKMGLDGLTKNTNLATYERLPTLYGAVHAFQIPHRRESKPLLAVVAFKMYFTIPILL